MPRVHRSIFWRIWLTLSPWVFGRYRRWGIGGAVFSVLLIALIRLISDLRGEFGSSLGVLIALGNTATISDVLIALGQGAVLAVVVGAGGYLLFKRTLQILWKRWGSKRFGQLWILIRPFFASEMGGWAKGLLCLLLALALSIKLVDGLLSFIGRDFMNALNEKREADFIVNLGYYLLAFAVATPFGVFYRYTEERLALLWRQWFSRHLIQRYLSCRSFYSLTWYEGIDNPDQRIEEDVRSFTATSLSFFLILLQSIIALFIFSGILFSISWTLAVVAVAYAAVGSVATYYVGRPLAALNYAQLKAEADYRYKLINVRDNAESIAFYRGERREIASTLQRLKIVVRNMLAIVNRNRLLTFFVSGYNYVTIILPTVVVAPLYLSGEVAFGVVTQATMAFVAVLNALSIIITHFGSLSAYNAVVRRLSAFWKALDEAEAESAKALVSVSYSTAPRLEFSKVSIQTPHHDRTLLKELTFSVEKGGVLISGESGSGKSSIIRVIAGLWNYGSGHLTRPDPERSFYLPQRPYMAMGSLRAQVLYGQKDSLFRTAELEAVLRQAGLADMLERVGGLDAERDWGSILSSGEQQRLCFARLFLARPEYVFMDEATTALDAKGEVALYEELQKFCKLWVSIGYSQGLRRFHHTEVVLKGNGTWTVEEIR